MGIHVNKYEKQICKAILENPEISKGLKIYVSQLIKDNFFSEVILHYYEASPKILTRNFLSYLDISDEDFNTCWDKFSSFGEFQDQYKDSTGKLRTIKNIRDSFVMLSLKESKSLVDHIAENLKINTPYYGQ